MSSTAQDATTFELGEAKLALRDNLRFSVQRGRRGKTYLIEDQATGDFFRVGEGEYTFISLLDGKTTLATALATTCSVVGAAAFNEQDGASLCKWLVETGLAQTKASTSAGRMSKRRDRVAKGKVMQLLNPISIRIPLFSPDRLVAGSVKYLGWLFSAPMAVVFVLVGLIAIVSFAASLTNNVTSAIEVFNRDDLIWLGATWLVLKLIHEYAHALACRLYGGRIRNCGVLFLLMIPLPFVDVTSAWRFGNKYHRILVSAAGMLAELFIAAIATLVWLRVDAGLTSQIAANIMFAASVNTLVFNANPLMKFDGYHMLADWMELPNLQKYGNQHVMGVFRKHLLGLNASPLPWAGSRGTFVKAYGWGSLVWKVLICVSLVLGAANLLPGIGFLIALSAVALWLAIPTTKFIKFLVMGNDFEQPNRLRFATTTLVGASLIVAIGSFAPSPTVINAPIVIQYEPITIVRCETTGFIESVHVRPDQMVKAGDVLFTMRDLEQDTRLIETKSRLKEAQLAASAKQKERDIGAWQIEQQNIVALEKQLSEALSSVAQLTITAEMDGQVLFDDPDALLETYVLPGTELLTIGNPIKKEAIAMVSQDDARHLNAASGTNIDLRIWGSSDRAIGKVREVTPRVRTDLPHFAFAGMYGGPLTVVNRAQYQDGNEQPLPEDTSQLVLLQPRLAMHIALDAKTSMALRSGQTGQAYLRLRSGSLGPYLIDCTTNWFKSRIQTTHGL